MEAGRSAGDAGAAWLYALEVPLGNVSGHHVGSSYRFENIVCTHFVASSLYSSFRPETELDVNADGISLFCTGVYHIDSFLIFRSRGRFNASATLDLNVTTSITTNFSQPMPAKSNATCETAIGISTLSFKGKGLFTKIIDILDPLLRRTLPVLLKPKICDVVDDVITNNVTRAIDDVDNMLDQKMPAPFPAPKSFPKSIVDLDGAGGMASWLLGWANNEVERVVGIATGGTGVLSLPVGLTLPIPSFAGASMTVNHINFTDLNTTTLTSLLTPRDHYFLDTALTFNSLGVSMDVSVDLESPSDPVSENLTISADLGSVAVGFRALLAVDSERFLDLNVLEASQLSCWAKNEVLFNVNVTQLNATMDIRDIRVDTKEGQLETEVTTLMNNVLAYMLATNREHISETLDAVTNGYFRTVINERLQKVLSETAHTCQSHVSRPHDNVDWRSSTLLDTASFIDDQLLNSLVGVFVPSGHVSLSLPESNNTVLDTEVFGLHLMLKLREMDVSGLEGTFFNTSLLEATSPVELRTRLGVGGGSRFDAYIDAAYSIDGGRLFVPVEVNQTFDHLHVTLSQDLEISRESLELTVREVVNGLAASVSRSSPSSVSSSSSAPSPPPSPASPALSVPLECFMAHYVAGWNLSVSEVAMSGELTRVGENHGVMRPLLGVLEALSPSLVPMIESFTSTIPGTVDDTVNVRISDMRYKAPYYCQNINPPPDTHGDAKATFTLPHWAIALIGSGGFCVVLTLLILLQRRNAEKIDDKNAEKTNETQSFEHKGAWKVSNVDHPTDTPRSPGGLEDGKHDTWVEETRDGIYAEKDEDAKVHPADHDGLGEPLLHTDAASTRGEKAGGGGEWRALCDHPLMRGGEEGHVWGWIIQLTVPGLLLAYAVTKAWALQALVTQIRLQAVLDETGETFFDEFLLGFNFANTIDYFWKSKAHLITSLVVVGVCILPFFTFVLVAVAWAGRIPASLRGSILVGVGMWGKAAYIDIIFQCYMMMVMSIDVHLAGITLHLTANPSPGTFGSLACTTTFLLITHLIHYLHNCTINEQAHPSESAGRAAPSRSLWQIYHQSPALFGDLRGNISETPGGISRLERDESRGSESRKWVWKASAVVGGVVVACGLMVAVWYNVVIRFTLTGVVAEVASGARAINRDYKVWQIPSLLPQNTYWVSGAYVLSAVYSGLVLVFPLMVIATWMILWLVPCQPRRQRDVYAAVTRVWSFSGLEVFWMGSFAAVMEINKIVVWLLNHTMSQWCDGALTPVADVCNQILPLSDTENLLHVGPTLRTGAYWLLVEIIVFYAIQIATMHLGGPLLGYTSKTGSDSGMTAKGMCSSGCGDGWLFRKQMGSAA